ncbi:aminoglycoside phosphotransferase family protein [Streptomyces niveus]|uniref:aminoglycoside phosphotransferase family protein n=1 Tax=Streptomyces niveus TaxID=193462 RepID=UPI0036B17799
MIVVPEEFARCTVEREGEPGAAWLAGLPGIVEELLGRWDHVPDGAVTHGGVGIVVPVRRRGDGAERASVLKVSFPHPGNVHEPDAFAVWAGRGAVHLYARDDRNFAMLLERARTSTLAEVGDTDEVPEAAGRLSRRLAVPAPREHPRLPRLSGQAGAWEDQLRKDATELAHTMPPSTVDAAVATVRELGREQPELIVHGDLHARNILRAEREPWLAVDPKGCVGDPAYDAGTLLTSRTPALLDAPDPGKAAHRILDIFGEAAELDRVRARRWAQLRFVQAAFWGRRHGFRVARGGPGLDVITQFADGLAELLARRA